MFILLTFITVPVILLSALVLTFKLRIQNLPFYINILILFKELDFVVFIIFIIVIYVIKLAIL